MTDTRPCLAPACAPHCTQRVFNLAIYQPANRFWLFQGIEAAIYVGLGATLLAAALWWLRHRVG